MWRISGWGCGMDGVLLLKAQREGLNNGATCLLNWVCG